MKIHKIIIIISIFLIFINVSIAVEQTTENTCADCFDPTISTCTQIDATKVCMDSNYKCCAGTISEIKKCSELGGTCFDLSKKTCLGEKVIATCDSNQACCSVNQFKEDKTQLTKVYTFCSNPIPAIQDVCNEIEKYNTLEVDIDGKPYSYLHVIYGSINPEISAQAIYSQAEGFQKIAALRKSYIYPSAEEPFLTLEKQYMDISGFSITYGESSLHGQFIALIKNKENNYYYNYKVTLVGGQSFYTFTPNHQNLYIQGGYDSITKNDNFNIPDLYQKIGFSQFKATDIQKVEMQVYTSNELNSNILFTRKVDFGSKTASELLGYTGSTSFQTVQVDTRGISLQMSVDPKDQDYFYEFKIVTNAKTYNYPGTGRLTKASVESPQLIQSKYYNDEKPIKIILNAYVSSTSITPVYTVEKILDPSYQTPSYKDKDCQQKCNEGSGLFKLCSVNVCSALSGCKPKTGEDWLSRSLTAVKNTLAYAECVSTAQSYSSSGSKAFVNDLKNTPYWPYILNVKEKDGIDVAAMVVGLMSSEGGLNPKAENGGCKGLMQFCEQTAQQYGLCDKGGCKIRDDRFDPQKSIDAAARLVVDLYKGVPSNCNNIKHYAVALSYNSGQGITDKVCISQISDKNDFFNKITLLIFRAVDSYSRYEDGFINDKINNLKSWYLNKIGDNRNCAYKELNNGIDDPNAPCILFTSAATSTSKVSPEGKVTTNVVKNINQPSEEYCNSVKSYVILKKTSSDNDFYGFRTDTNTNNQLIKIYGSNQPEYIFDLNLIVKKENFLKSQQTIFLHEKAMPILLCAEKEIISSSNCNYELKNLQDFMSGNNLPNQKGRDSIREAGRTCPTNYENDYCSRHLFGIAFDLNPEQNPYCKTSCSFSTETNYKYTQPTDCSTGPTPCQYNLPQCVIDIFESYGFQWGGTKVYNYDYMHFDLAINPENIPATAESKETNYNEEEVNGGTLYKIAYPSTYIKYDSDGAIIKTRPEKYPNEGAVWVSKSVEKDSSVPLVIALHGWRELDSTGNIFIGKNSHKAFDLIAQKEIDTKKTIPLIIAAPMDDIGPEKTVFSEERFNINEYIGIVEQVLSEEKIKISSISIIGHSNAICEGAIENILDKYNSNYPIYFIGLADSTCPTSFGNKILSIIKGRLPISILFLMYNSNPTLGDINSGNELMNGLTEEYQQPYLAGYYKTQKVAISQQQGISIYVYQTIGKEIERVLPVTEHYTSEHSIIPGILFTEAINRFFTVCKIEEPEQVNCFCKDGTLKLNINPCPQEIKSVPFVSSTRI